MLLIIEALLLILAALGQDHRAAAAEQIFPLDMALNSVDDQYKGCTKEMMKLVNNTYLKKELNNSDTFAKAWEMGKNKVTHNIFSKLKRNHKIAIWVYTDPESNIYVKFNNDTRNDKQNYTDNTYKWYSLHFLLTDAIQILKKNHRSCINTFRRTNVTFNGKVSSRIRFGSFTSSSLNNTQPFGNKSCFEIFTCEGANITKYSRLQHEKEVLIPPYETFTITAVKNRDWCETVFVLNSTGTESELNCALFKNRTEYYSRQ